MALKKSIACTLTALALAGAAAGTATAADEGETYEKSNQTNCEVLEVIDIPIISSANNNIDCSRNVKKEDKKDIRITDESEKKAETNLFIKKDEYR